MPTDRTNDPENGRLATHDRWAPASSEVFARTVRDFAASEVFRRTFEDGMSMVEETAAYLDGPGREASKALPRKIALAYAGESMRLTTRLMQVASWLLVQRAILEGEMTPAQAAQEKYRLGSKEVCFAPAMEGTDLLPARLLQLLERSMQLYDRVDRLDQMIYRAEPQVATRGVSGELSRLARALDARFED